MAAFRESMQGKTFTFLIGEKEEPFLLHSKFIEPISEALWKMMTNGMEDTVNATAKLPDTDPDTFALFCEYAYTNSYSTTEAPAKLAKLAALDLPVHGLKQYYCRLCGSYETASENNREIFPFCSLRHKTSLIASPLLYNRRCACCTTSIGNASYTPSTPHLCPACELKQKSETLDECDVEVFQIGGKFGAVKIAVGARTHAQVRKTLKGDITNQIIDHARLHVFADMYMVEELKQLTLHKLHRDLVRLELSQANDSHIIEMLSYVYQHTQADSKSETGEEVTLRSLARLYAVENVQELFKSVEFQELLECGGSLNVEIIKAVLTGD